MARIRTIKPEAYEDEDLALVSLGARWVFAATWTYVDDEGRALYIPSRLQSYVFPHEPNQDIEVFLEELAALGFLHFYEADGRRLFHVPNLRKHQKIDKPTKSKLPSPESVCPGCCGEISANTLRGLSEDSAPGKGKGNGKGKGEGRAPARETSPPLSTPSGETLAGIDTDLEEIRQQGETGVATDFGSAAPAAGRPAAAAAVVQSAASQHQRFIGARKRAEAWQFSAEDRAALAAAGEAIGVLADDLPGEIGSKLAKPKNDADTAYDVWFSLSAAEIAEWCAAAAAEACRASKPSIEYVSGIIRARLNGDRKKPGTVVNFPQAQAEPPEAPPERFADRVWFPLWSVVRFPVDRDRVDALIYRSVKFGWQVDEPAVWAAFEAGGPAAAMDALWLAKPEERAV
jgi:hypothetical protein